MSGPPQVEARLQDHVAFGQGAVSRLPAIVEELGGTRVLLVCGRRSFEASGAARVLPDLERVATVTRWDAFSPNTDAEDLGRGLELLAEVEPDVVLGVGGGSAMDMAKLLCAFEGVAPGRELLEAINEGARVERRRPALVLVPTTSGSGSEATHFAVLYVGHAKHSVAGPAMRPDRVVLDPDLSASASARQRAASGIDALCQAIESRWAAAATDESREHARAGLRLTLEHLETFVVDPGPHAARGMALGSHLAGRAIDVSKTTAAHALSYGITKRHGVPHGHAVALTLGAFIEDHAGAGVEDLQPGISPEEHAAAVEEVLESLGASDGAEASARWDQLMERIGLEPRLPRLCGGDPAELATLAATVNVERLSNNPMRLDEDGLRRILARSG